MNKDKLLNSLNEIKTLAETCIEALSENGAPKPKPAKQDAHDSGGSPILKIVNKIKGCAESDKIEAQILDKHGTTGRILLPFYICYKYFPQQGLTSGDIEKITAELRVKIKTSNVSTAITNSLQRFLDGSSTRVKGKAVSYRLNRKGAKHFETLLTPNGG